MVFPPKYTVNREMIEYLGKIEAIRQYLNSINIPLEIQQKIHRVSLLKSSLYSAKIEGNPLEIGNLQNSSDKIKKLEVDNILKAMNHISRLNIGSANGQLFKEIHKIVMEKIHYQAGHYRQEMSAIFNQSGVAVYVCPPPDKVPQLTEQLADYINSRAEDFPLIKAFMAHLLFEKIHPFLDGNGRVGRLVIFLVCHIFRYEFNPVISFEEYLNDNKSNYYYYLDIGLKRSEDYLLFMLKAYFSQAEKIKAEVEAEVSKKVMILLPPRQEEILEIIKDHRMVSLDFIKRRFLKVPARTLRYDLKKLCDKNLINKIGKTRGSFYRIK